MCRQTPSGPTSTQTPFEVEQGAGCGAAEDGAAAGVVAAPGSAPPLRVVPPPVVPPVPVLVPPPWRPPPWLPPGWLPRGWRPPRARARLGDVGSEEPRPEPGWVSCLLPVLWPGPPRPAARPCDVPEMGIGPTEATGEVPAADDWVVVRGVGRTRMETVENSRNAI